VQKKLAASEVAGKLWADFAGLRPLRAVGTGLAPSRQSRRGATAEAIRGMNL
jgi:hypothetical protein